MLNPNQIINGRHGGQFQVLSMATLEGTTGAHLRLVSPNSPRKRSKHTIWLPLDMLDMRGRLN